MMLKDLESAVRKIAQFLSAKLTEEQVARIAHKNTFANVRREVGNTPLHRQGTNLSITVTACLIADGFTCGYNKLILRTQENMAPGRDS